MNARPGFSAVVAIVLAVSGAWADPAPSPSAPSALPGSGFDGGRYENLWTKSPFAIATPDAPPASQDYQLVGMVQINGISYVSLIEKQSQEHFGLSSDKPVKNLKLVSISRGPSGASAVIMRNGESLTLHQEEAPAAAPMTMAPGMNIPQGIPVPQPGMVPSPNPSVGGMVPAAMIPPRARFHRPIIRVPPPPPTQ